MLHQFASLGLHGTVAPAHTLAQDEVQQWRADWNFDPRIHMDADSAAESKNASSVVPSSLYLVSPAGKVVASWHYPTPPADVWLQIESRLGAPAGAQQMPACHSPANQ
jgi:hypothetical protein